MNRKEIIKEIEELELLEKQMCDYIFKHIPLPEGVKFKDPDRIGDELDDLFLELGQLYYESVKENANDYIRIF